MEDDTFDFFDTDSPKERDTPTQKYQQKRARSRSPTPPRNNPEPTPSKTYKKIEAKVPSVPQPSPRESDLSDSDEESDRSSSKDGGRKSPASPDKYTAQSNGKRSPVAKQRRSSAESSVSSRSVSSYTSASDTSDVTDVSPLQTPAYTPQSKKYVSAELDRYANSDKKPPTPVRFTGAPRSAENVGPHERIQSMIKEEGGTLNMEILMQAMMELDGESSHYGRQDKADRSHVHFNTGQSESRNYSFSVEKAKAIDRENKRLLEKLMRYEVPPPTRKRAQPKVKKAALCVTPSALNRQRELARIERENYALLKRLEKARPTNTLARDPLLREYNNKTIAGHSVAGAHYRQKKCNASRQERTLLSPSQEYLDYHWDRDPETFTRPKSAVPTQVSSGRPSSGRPVSERPASGRIRPWSADTRKPVNGQDKTTTPSQHKHFPKPRPAWDSRW